MEQLSLNWFNLRKDIATRLNDSKVLSAGQWFSNFRESQNRLERLLKHITGRNTPRVSALVGLGWSPKFCSCNTIQVDADASGLGITL